MAYNPQSMEAEEFNYYFEHGEFMPMPPSKLREVQHDTTIERPARKISMIDGYAEEKAEAEAQKAAENEAAAPAEAETPAEEKPEE